MVDWAAQWLECPTALHTPHPAQTAGKLEPGLEATLCRHHTHWQDLQLLRQEVVGEVRCMVDAWQPTTQHWFRQLPPEIQGVYSANGTKLVTQVPLLLHLLRICGFEGVDELEEDLTHAFQWLGSSTPAAAGYLAGMGNTHIPSPCLNSMSSTGPT